jgi:branched-chain amino acid transport system ATP-binding protein
MWEAVLLSVRDVEVRYGTYIAVAGVSIEVGAGEVVCLLGHNGSGKSSLLNAISGLVTPVAGDVVFEAQRLNGVATHRLLELGLAHVLERRRLFPYMTVLENLQLGAYLPALRGGRSARLEEVYTLFPILRQRRHQLASTLSGGEQQQVSIARALMGRPKFLMLDEPFLGLSPKLVELICDTIQRINRAGVTVLFSEQAIQLSLKISDRGYILESGRLAMGGKSRDMLADERLHRIYMGLDNAGERHG